MPSPLGALPTSFRAQKYGMAMSMTTQISFPLHVRCTFNSTMNVQMAAQDACMTRSFHVFLSAMLIVDDQVAKTSICRIFLYLLGIGA